VLERRCVERPIPLHGTDKMMADNKKKRGGTDHALIALGEPYEVAYWSKEFKVTPAG
jgi:hypothetical protein